MFFYYRTWRLFGDLRISIWRFEAKLVGDLRIFGDVRQEKCEFGLKVRPEKCEFMLQFD